MVQSPCIWLLLDTRHEDAGTLVGVEIVIEGVLADGVYNVEFWETYEGNVIGTVTAAVENDSPEPDDS